MTDPETQPAGWQEVQGDFLWMDGRYARSVMLNVRLSAHVEGLFQHLSTWSKL